jgi:hypothetical protein
MEDLGELESSVTCDDGLRRTHIAGAPILGNKKCNKLTKSVPEISYKLIY